MNLATLINAYLTPARRQAIYQLIGVVGVVLTALSPAMSTPVARLTQILFALGTVASLILAAVMTKAPQWPAIYSGLAALVAALVGASLLTAGAADVALRIVQAAITLAPLVVILARTDTSTADGSPSAEVPAIDAATTPAPAIVADPVVVASPTVTVLKSGTTEWDPANGDPTTTTLS